MAFAQSDESLFAQMLVIGRIEEGERESCRRVAELARIAAENLRHTADAERIDIGPDQRARLGRRLDKERLARAARQSLEPHCAGSGEEIDDGGIAHRVLICVRENIEDRLAQPV